ncbi:hypothetical protein FDC45_15670 [Clostridium botulinum]|uniref:MBL fold metallo-hydrolase n=1 Tax=Clostridium botulinum TaxID=1491 RepID=A0A846J693_CLOBO|nr:hypothetical protein [Clostridium botulinum]ACA54577.1 hypothetical protein CLK_1304 [Clostridium botulinum A3 str. Loch Maree]NFH67589.1 hypothetical protein [Clostridium botulinum]NFJ08741.1 hypothetical protein [Clostridium botulinum]NFK15137.1 hypothetical protein [Clostridium botulinum]NFM93097.1 hypothetical protein [Clostridium botulinum]
MGIIKNYLPKVKDLFIEIYLIGYNSAGESVLFLIKSKTPENKIIFSGVIDCYEENGINRTIELIDELNIDKLNFLCWTHPDEDHSLGIDKIFEKYTDRHTRIVIPQSLLELSNKLRDETKTLCNNIGQNVIKKKDREMYDIVEAQAGMKLIDLSIGSEVSMNPYKFYISSISPFYDLVLSQCENKNLKNNHFSIALLLEFEGINLLFTSDIEKRTINRFYENISLPEQIHYVKIPHHGSNKSRIFLDYLDYCNIRNGVISCSTVYSNCNLPDINLLNDYKNRYEKVFCTNCNVKTNTDGKNGYGTLGVRIDVINKKISYKCFQDAIKL